MHVGKILKLYSETVYEWLPDADYFVMAIDEDRTSLRWDFDLIYNEVWSPVCMVSIIYQIRSLLTQNNRFINFGEENGRR